MGAWGVKALESDEGLDVVDFLEEYIPGHEEMVLADFLEALTKSGFFPKGQDEIEFWYDHSALAVSELYFMFADNQGFIFDGNEGEKNPFKTVKSFTADKESLSFLLGMLTDIKNEVPDSDGEREIAELWKESESWEEWSKNLDILMERLREKIYCP